MAQPNKQQEEFEDVKPLDEFEDVKPVGQKPVPAQPAYDPYHGALKSHWDATKYGLKEFGSGLYDTGKGILQSMMPTTRGDQAAMIAFGPAAPVAKGLYGLGKEAAQVPAAIHDLAQSPDPLGHIAMTAPHAGGEAAAQLLAAEAPRAIPRIAEVAPRLLKTAGKVAADLPVGKTIAKIPEMYRATAPEGELAAASQKAIGEGKANPLPTTVKEPPAPIDPVKQAVSEGRASKIPTKVPDVIAPYVREGTAARIPLRVPRTGSGNGLAPSMAGPEVNILPEPRQPFTGENEGYMASVPREELNTLAQTAKPGAGAQLQQLGKPVIYVPNEAGFPGPRSTTLMNEFGEPIKPVSGGSFGSMTGEEAPLSRQGSLLPTGGRGGLRLNPTPEQMANKPSAVPAPEYEYKPEGVKQPDIGEQARGNKSIPRGDRRARVRTADELATQDAWKQARKELGDDASSEDIESRVNEIKRGRL